MKLKLSEIVETLLFVGPLLLIKPAWALIGWLALPMLLMVGLALALICFVIVYFVRRGRERSSEKRG